MYPIMSWAWLRRRLMPAPDGPTTSVWPTSDTCRLKRNGVAPLVAANNKGGLCFGIRAEGFSRRPAHTDVIGSMSARFRVWSRTLRTLQYPSPGKDPRQASTALTVSTRHEKPRFWIVFITRRVLLYLNNAQAHFNPGHSGDKGNGPRIAWLATSRYF